MELTCTACLLYNPKEVMNQSVVQIIISDFMVSSQVSLTHGGDSNCCYYPTGLEETRRTVVKPVKPHVSRFLCSISITDPTGIETRRDDFHVNNITQ